MEKNTCWDCSERIDEECARDGHEVYPDSKACENYTSENNKHNDSFSEGVNLCILLKKIMKKDAI